MTDQKEYKPSFFDRHGPEGYLSVRALIVAVLGFAVIVGVLMLLLGIFNLRILIVASVGACLVGGISIGLANTTGGVLRRVLVHGKSTPYIEQYSYQQSMVMRGDLDGALESFEAVIAEKPDAVSPRVKAAELYDRDQKNHQRAAELFREVLRIPTVTPGEYIYACNRLVDLLTGPLNDPGRALVELRRMIERYPTSPAAAHARTAIAGLKVRAAESDRGSSQ